VVEKMRSRAAPSLTNTIPFVPLVQQFVGVGCPGKQMFFQICCPASNYRVGTSLFLEKKTRIVVLVKALCYKKIFAGNIMGDDRDGRSLMPIT
jgi:hypothetical protein